MGQIFQRMTRWILGPYWETLHQNSGNITYQHRQSRPSSGITEADVLRASDIIAEARDRNSGLHGEGTQIFFQAWPGTRLVSERLTRQEAGSIRSAASMRKGSRWHVGSHYNEWRDPVIAYGNNHPHWLEKAAPYTGEMDFEQGEWNTAKTLIDTTLELLLKEMQSETAKYKGLQIIRYVRQGSSREGLKVIAPDEFDTLLLYCIDGLNFKKKSSSETPEYCSLLCTNKYDALINNFPVLFAKGVFKHVDCNGEICLNSRALHQHVFQAIIDHSVNKTVKLLNQLESRGKNTSFQISRIMNPPSINLKLTLFPDGVEIDVDIVPGLLLRQDKVADPAQPNQTMDCPVYAVFRWTEESDRKAAKFSDTEVVWRVCTSGYEKHTFDLAQCHMQQRYIITSLRILKTYFQKSKMSFKEKQRNQLVSVLRSYHLKHIAFYVLLFTQYLKPGVVLIGVSEATEFFLGFLRVSLEKNLLPHFFHSNKYVTCMFPNYPVNHNALRFNLLGRKTKDALRQALLSFEKQLVPLLGCEKVEIDPVMEHIVYQYDQFISEGEYF